MYIPHFHVVMYNMQLPTGMMALHILKHNYTRWMQYNYTFYAASQVGRYMYHAGHPPTEPTHHYKAATALN